jgi:hypothetical protein
MKKSRFQYRKSKNAKKYRKVMRKINTTRKTNKQQKGGGRPIKFGMLFSVPRNIEEARLQISNNIESILTFKPNIIGIVSPSDVPGTTTRTDMWDLFVTKLQEHNLTRLVMQHFPYTTVGSVGKIAGTSVTMGDISTRIDAIQAKGISSILGLKGWEQNQNYLGKNAVAALQPEYLFPGGVPEWIAFLKTRFANIAGTTYIEGHPFRRRMLEAANNPANFHAIKTEYNFTGKPYHAGILKKNLLAGIHYDVQKIKAGATKIFCAHIFEASLFVSYKKMFEEIAKEEGVGDKYELIPEISVGASKQSFYNDTLLSSTYCPDEFQNAILRSGLDTFVEGAKVKVIGRGAELSEKEKANRKYYHNATIVTINKECPGLECYNVKYDDEKGHVTSEIEENVPISRISTTEADRHIRNIWIQRLKEQIAIFKDNNVSSLYIVSIDMNATLELIRQSLESGLLESSPELY